MKQFREFVMSALLSGLLLAVPLYLAVLLLLKAMGALVGLVRPIALMLPRWSHGEDVLAFLIVLFLCFVIGVGFRSAGGRAVRERIEGSLLAKIPGYLLLRSLTTQLAGESQENVWKPALAEIENALVPAFIIEEFEDGIRSLSRLPPRPSVEPSTSWAGNACIPSTPLLRRPFRRYRGGDRGQEILSQP